MSSSGGRQLPPTRARASFAPTKGGSGAGSTWFRGCLTFPRQCRHKVKGHNWLHWLKRWLPLHKFDSTRRRRWGLRGAGGCEWTDVTVPGRWSWRGDSFFFPFSNPLCIKHDLPAFWDVWAMSHRLETLQYYFISHPDKILMEPTRAEWRMNYYFYNCVKTVLPEQQTSGRISL